MSNTLKGIGPGRWDKRALFDAQVDHAKQSAIVYRLYTEDYRNPIDLVSRYFPSATFYLALGLWEGATETARVIEIIGTLDDLQRIADLAGDIKVRNHQTSILVTYAPIKRLDV